MEFALKPVFCDTGNLLNIEYTSKRVDLYFSRKLCMDHSIYLDTGNEYICLCSCLEFLFYDL